jgi:LysM repeat protein
MQRTGVYFQNDSQPNVPCGRDGNHIADAWIREKTEVCDLYELTSINGRPVCDFLGGMPAPVTAEAAVETPQPVAAAPTTELGVTYDTPNAAIPESYSTVVRPKSEQTVIETNLTRSEYFEEQATPVAASTMATTTEADCSEAAAEGEHLVQRGESLYGIARRYGISVGNLRAWNGLKSDAIYPCSALKLYAPEVVEDAPSVTEAPVEAAPVEEIPVSYNVVTTKTPKPVAKINCNVEAYDGEHVVMQGENLSGISRSYGVKVSDLIAWNGLPNDRIQPCQKLLVIAPTNSNEPAKEYVAVTAKTPKKVPVEYKTVRKPQQKNMLKTVTIAAPPLPKPIPVRNTAPPKQTVTAKSAYVKKGTGLHVVQKGETIAGLAKQFKMSEAEFRKINYLTKDEAIFIGQVVRTESCACSVEVADDNSLKLKPAPISGELAGVPVQYSTVVKPKNTEGVTAKSPDRAARKYHVVQSGETVYSIAKLYKMDMANLRTINNLEDSEVIIPNQLLKLE